ncbi:MAG: OmpA family protein [Dehalococcoidia bacterium]|nr:OmpA family protein [Dehalococcoidia bacterium]
MSRRKKGHAEGGEADERWVISYADLVTLLFGFFILLYATADQNVTKFESLARGLSDAFNVPVNEGLRDGTPLFNEGTGIVPGSSDQTNAVIEQDLLFVRNLVQRESSAHGLVGRILVSEEADGISIRLADNLVFPTASANLRPEALPLLDIVAVVLTELGREVRVEGHTDNIPLVTHDYASNWELSGSRATAVVRYLVDEGDVNATLIFSAGYGEFRPVADNLTPEGRALNRRADIVILYPDAQIGTEGAGPLGSDFGIAPSGSGLE